MPELLIKIGDNFPHKDLMLWAKTTDPTAKDDWIYREAQKYKGLRLVDAQGKEYEPDTDQRIALATSRWAEKVRGCVRQGDIIQVRPDGTPYGKRESAPRLYKARISLKEIEKLGLKNPKDLRQPCWELPPWEDPEGAGRYYHKWGWRLTPEAFGRLKADSIVELFASDLVRKTGYEDYDVAKALEHNSAGTLQQSMTWQERYDQT